MNTLTVDGVLFSLLNIRSQRLKYAKRHIILSAGELRDEAAGAPKRLCSGFTLNVKCARVISNLSLSRCLCGETG